MRARSLETYRAFWSASTGPSILVSAEWDGSRWAVTGREFTVSLWHSSTAGRLSPDLVGAAVSRTRTSADGRVVVKESRDAHVQAMGIELVLPVPDAMRDRGF